MAINYKNASENLVIIIIGFTLGFAIGASAMYYTLIGNTKQNIESFTPIAKEAINKETVHNTVSHDVDVAIAKIKKSDSLKIQLVQKPITEQKPITKIETIVAGCSEDEICIKTIHLTRKQRKRLGVKK